MRPLHHIPKSAMLFGLLFLLFFIQAPMASEVAPSSPSSSADDICDTFPKWPGCGITLCQKWKTCGPCTGISCADWDEDKDGGDNKIVVDKSSSPIIGGAGGDRVKGGKGNDYINTSSPVIRDHRTTAPKAVVRDHRTTTPNAVVRDHRKTNNQNQSRDHRRSEKPVFLKASQRLLLTNGNYVERQANGALKYVSQNGRVTNTFAKGRIVSDQSNRISIILDNKRRVETGQFKAIEVAVQSHDHRKTKNQSEVKVKVKRR